jgi:2-polyprenyl-3-methyl-5-hydroxy-6-metoxy-1,4-benzoquinol methylase
MTTVPAQEPESGTRYDFGRNWSELAAHFDDRHIDEACVNLKRLVGDLRGKSFLDVGCGSGLHSLAAVRLGARQVYALDYDNRCVDTARAVLKRFAENGAWQVEPGDALNPNTFPEQKFDVVYSWGVLHHTGDMWTAISNASKLVSDGGHYCLALYLKTPLCGAWTVEKRLYSKHSRLRGPIKAGFVAAFVTIQTLKARNAASYIRNYKKSRGMEFLVDVDDWLGGYPYESVRPRELERFVEGLGFETEARFNQKIGSGLFGTGCGEWNFRKSTKLAQL